MKVTKDMLDLAKHIVEKKSGAFEPEKFEDHYETALVDLIDKKRSGVVTGAKAAPKTGGNVINLMDALKRSLASEQPSPAPAKAKGKKSRKAAAGQREMLLPISGKRNKGRNQESRQAGPRPRSIQKGRINAAWWRQPPPAPSPKKSGLPPKGVPRKAHEERRELHDAVSKLVHAGLLQRRIHRSERAVEEVPIPLTAVTMTMLMPTAIRQYSIAVAPDWSRQEC